jgi:dTDP-4-dehydrorhamnose reductase
VTGMDRIEGFGGRRILLAGSGGQVGIAFRKVLPRDADLRALSREDLDITNADSVNEAIKAFRPDWIINAAAYTAVDRAEAESALAFAVNRDGAANLARAAAANNARMVHISTDYVFDGNQAHPYGPGDPVNPINVYGESKLAGELAVREILEDRLLILRTAWVYAPHGRNFLMTMLRLMRERDELGIVEDQIGTPTGAASLSNAILQAMNLGLTGTHHWTDAGVASWYDFAHAIRDYLKDKGAKGAACRLRPIPTHAYPTPARRPACTVLSKESFRQATGLTGDSWRDLLRSALDSLAI